ncbi:MAG: RNA chaperone Hfq [Saccharofermentanales bacterium]
MTNSMNQEDSTQKFDNKRGTKKAFIKPKNMLCDNEKEFHNSRKFLDLTDNSWNDPLLAKSRNPNITDSFLNNCRHDKTELVLTLHDNKSEKGIIVGFDNQALTVYNPDKKQFLVMRSGIIMITPLHPVNYIFKGSYRPEIISDPLSVNYPDKPEYLF